MAETLLDNLWKGSSESFVLTDRDGFIFKANPSFYKLLKFEADGTGGKNLFDFFNDHFREEIKVYYEKIDLVREYTPCSTSKIQCTDGLEKDIEYTIIYTQTQDNQKLFLTIIHDISKQREYETAIAKAKEHIEETDRLKTSFLANMSHEIRTPMNGIIGFSGMLLDPELSHEKRVHYIEIITSSCYQLLQLINDIMDLSKIEAGEITIRNNEFYLNEIINKLCNSYVSTANSKGLTFTIKPGRLLQDSKIIADEMKLGQVIANLLSNAFKFTSEGGVEIGYSIKSKEIEFYVRDTGIGIDQLHYQSIFERFRQTDIGNTRKYGGTGIGLPISKSFIEHMGGRIWFESIVHSGSTFYFTIPYKPIVVNEKAAQVQAETFDWESKTILIAEDEEINFIYLAEVLLDTNIKIIRAFNGIHAIEQFKENHTINLILMDIKMPELNGYEATKIIKQINHQIPIIAHTAYAMASDRDEAITAGCDDYISKPANREQLLSIIQKYLF
jgi:PAS domain S-box-containing protein